MRLLVLGGTSFLGWSLAQEAVARGHDVTTFNRGITGAPPAGCQEIRGDRTSAEDLARIAREAWDAAIDTSGYVPRWVGLAARALSVSVGRYAFVSTISAYDDRPDGVIGVGSPLYDCDADAGPDAGHYGVLKAGSERAVLREVGEDRTLMLRPGIILGPRENVGRLPWWLQRVAEGGRVLAPADPARGMQHIDARDIAIFTLDLLGRGQGGTWDVVGPRGVPTWGEWLGECVRVTGSQAQLDWVPDDVLLAAGVEPWSELPLWMPGPSGAAVVAVDDSDAKAAGLRTRPWQETVADTWAWLQGGARPVMREGIGLAREKEQAILQAR